MRATILQAATFGFASALALVSVRADAQDNTSGNPNVVTPDERDAREKAAAADWHRDYARARDAMRDGRLDEAEQEMSELADRAPTEADRTLALEMAQMARDWAAHLPRQHHASVRRNPVRTRDELTLLYTTAFLYGAGTGVWFLLQTKPGTALTATAPFAALTAAPIIAVATLDGRKKLPRGVPHALSAGAYIGLGEGVWLSGYAQGRASRIARRNPRSSLHWGADQTSTVLWSGATLGATMGGVLGSTLVTTPGRVSYVTSLSTWSGAVVGLGANALFSEGDSRRESVYLTAGAGYNAGLAAGLWSAGHVSPSVARVRLVDLVGAAGAVSTTALYLSMAKETDVRLASGLAALGAVSGLSIGWWATSGMPAQRPEKTAVQRPITLQPSVQPVLGGATLGVAGAM